MPLVTRSRRLFASVAVAFTLSAFSGSAAARPLTGEEKMRDFEQLISLMKSGYGPLDYKRETQGIDIDALRVRYLPDVTATKTNLEFYYLVNRFVAEFKDSHFSARVPTDYRVSLGFATDLVGDKVLIESVNRDVLPEASFPYDRGDELVSIGGRPVAEAMAEIERYLGLGYQGTTHRLAAMSLPSRSARAMPVVDGAVTVEIRKKDSDSVSTADLTWKTAGVRPVDDEVFEPRDLISRSRRPGMSASGRVDAFDLSIRDLYADLFGEDAESSYRCSGKTRIKVPEGATIIMETPFVAYYHPHPADPTVNVGYLRIPHYSPDMDAPAGDEDPTATRFAQYEYAVSVLEKNTAGLIIDQDHNCGGSVFYLEDVVGLFAASTYDQMQFELLATKAEMLSFKEWVDMIDPHTLLHTDVKETYDLVKASWEQGGSRLTPKIGIRGRRALQPHTVRYTKPVLMLIDELSGSGGDAFPALMQGIGRAKLIGQRTMGAGGHVEEVGPLYFSGETLRLTKSLFYRPDGVPVENNGAVPDFEYAPTAADFAGEYADYQAFYLEKLREML
jgi:hypothetical protein